VRVGLLGPLQVEVDDTAVQLGSVKERGVLAFLALRAGSVVSVPDLISALWGDDPPSSAKKTLQTHVANLRKSLPAAAIATATASAGYSLAVARDDVDACRFDLLVAQGRQTDSSRDPAGKINLLTEALEIWRGEALADLRDQPLGLAEATRLEELRLGVEEDVIELRLDRGEHGVLVPDLERAVFAAPLRERRWRLLMLALYRSGRQADALRAYRRLWEQLDTEIGIRPSIQSTDLERAILLQSPELDLPATAERPVSPSSSSTPPAERHPAAGRHETTLLVCGIDDLKEFPKEGAERWYRSLADYHSLVVDQAERFNGRVIAAVGEIMYVQFDSAGEALHGAFAVLGDLRGRDVARAHVSLPRVAIHTAVFDWRDGETQGPEVRVAIGLLSSAHSGQILLTDAAAQACRPVLPRPTELEELGSFVLPGSRQLTTVYSAAVEPTSSESPPLRLAQLGRDELPVERMNLVGRDELVSEVLVMVRDAPLVTLWGPGGIGKTSVAVRIAALSSVPFDDGVRFVDLSVIRDARSVAEVVLSRLHGTASNEESTAEAVIRTLRTARLLLVLDSCEHVLGQAREIASSIVARCPWVRILVTSREPLGIGIEQRVEVPPLPVPAPTSGTCGRSPPAQRFGSSPSGRSWSSVPSGSPMTTRPPSSRCVAGWGAARWRWNWPPVALMSRRWGSWLTMSALSRCCRDWPGREDRASGSRPSWTRSGARIRSSRRSSRSCSPPWGSSRGRSRGRWRAS